MKNVLQNANTSINSRGCNVSEDVYRFLITSLCFVYCSLSLSAQTEVTSSEYQISRQIAAAMKSSDTKSSGASYVSTKELEKEINSVLNDIRVRLTDENTKIRFEASFAPEMYRKGEQACPSVSLKNLILGRDSYLATTAVSDQELNYALDLLKKGLDFCSRTNQ